MEARFRQLSIKRIVAAFLLIMFFFSLLLVQLFKLQVLSASELSEKQSYYMTRDMPLTASRGDIYDRNLNILVRDASCSMISVYPNSVKEPETLSIFLCSKLGLDYDSVYSKVTNTKLDYVTIKRGVENHIAIEIKDEKLSGVRITEDKKRYYVDSTSAAYVLGFLGSEHLGMYGVESVLNSILQGIDGRQTVLTDSQGRVIESENIFKVESQPGRSVSLTLDSILQYYTDNAVLEAYLQHRPKRVIALVSDPYTGELLAASAYPSYDMSNAWNISDDFQTAFSKDFAGKTLGEQQLEMWKNPFTSFIYEPGSTFKTITVSSALNEGVVSTSSTFNCSGSLLVSGIRVKCHIFPRSHGHETLTQALVNSCNPAMMNIVMSMGGERFYAALRNYGFGKKTGIKLDGEENGLLTDRSGSAVVNYATLGFGQGLSVTPLQLLMAENAAINGGVLYEPMLVKSEINTATGDIIVEHSPKVVRNVISEAVSSIMVSMLRESGERTMGLNDYKDLKIGGKTGTAQKIVDGAYAQGKNVANFYGFAPYDDPKLSVLVIVDEPTGDQSTGSMVAAPVAAKILSQAIGYVDSRQSGDYSSRPAFIVPDMRGKTKSEAVATLESLGATYELTGDHDGIVTDQSILREEYIPGRKIVIDVTSSDTNTVLMPDLKGMSVQQANSILSSLGLVLNASGGGIAVSQSVEKDTFVTKNSVISVTFKYIQ
ncbi:MAG: penicillin-binding transpeptidase domain-containing protein [Eubacteriaceae bacterium]|nr:penicillin-binding transpeptidase domain-containing protein [Eubacteriaceae bacterium]